MRREDFEIIYKQGADLVYDLIEALYNTIDELKEIVNTQNTRIKELENQIAKDSSNNSKPPSSDGYKKPQQSKSNKPRRKRKPGGQKGHKGYKLQFSDNPDEIIRHKVKKSKNCQKDFQSEDKEISRFQEYEIPAPKMHIKEHQIEIGTCSCCGKKTIANHPKNVYPNQVQYGSRFKSLRVYLNQYQLIPNQRTAELIYDLFGQNISTGTLYNAIKSCYHKLADAEEHIKLKILSSKVAHFDESGGYCSKIRKWFHVASTKLYTFIGFHANRGRIAMNQFGILSEFLGFAVHDFYSSYIKYPAKHILCSAHLIRELKFLFIQENQTWAQELRILLVLTHKLVQREKRKRKYNKLPKSKIYEIETKFDKIIKSGMQKNPRNKGTPGKTGKRPQSDARNLLERLAKWKDAYLMFIHDFDVPFDNNLAERDIRMLKVQQKISGCFRSESGARYFCRIRGYISTIRKNGINVFEALNSAMKNDPILP